MYPFAEKQTAFSQVTRLESILGAGGLGLLPNTGMPQPRLTSRPMRVSDRLIVVEIAFAKKSLRQVCESERTARHSLGAAVAEKLKRRLADLRAANSVKDLVAGRPKELTNARAGQISLELAEGFRLILSANHNVPPLLEGTRVDWSKVSRIKIISIEDTDA